MSSQPLSQFLPDSLDCPSCNNPLPPEIISRVAALNPDYVLNPILKLKTDLRKAAVTLSTREARYLVDAYYSIQDFRKATGNQARALSTSGEPHDVITWFLEQNQRLEEEVKRALTIWTSGKPLGRWAKSITGIGPVIAAGLLANIDITQAPTVGRIWRMAGLDPTQEWLGKDKSEKYLKGLLEGEAAGSLERATVLLAAKIGCRYETLLRNATTDFHGKPKKLTVDGLARAGARRPWNARLKTLCWKIGESFVKTSGLESDYYGHLWLQRKAYELNRNRRGELVEEAERKLAKAQVGKGTDAWPWYAGCYPLSILSDWEAIGEDVKASRLKSMRLEPGRGVRMLPPGHIHARSKRWTVKLFLAHYHHVAFRLEYGQDPPKPYVIEHKGHVDYIPPPKFEG